MTQLPVDFLAQMKAILGEEYDNFITSLQSKAPTSIRINNKVPIDTHKNVVDWCPQGFYLNERPLFTADPLFHGGAYYVQEASSMFLFQAIKQLMPYAQRVLDLCAAPGGKTTLLAQNLSSDCLLISNEVIRQRSQILAENVAKWGNPNVVVTNNEPAELGKLTHYFDAIIVDAPCSGEGMFRKDSNAILEWSTENVKTCVNRQRDILNDIWDALKPNGILVYSTCTFNKHENEENIQWACNELGAKIIKLNIDNNKIVETDAGYRFYPHRTEGEGFFMSILQKNEDQVLTRNLKYKAEKNIKSISYNNQDFKLIDNTNYNYFESDNKLFALNKKHSNDLLFFRKQFNCLIVGIELFEIKGKDLIPSEYFALSKALDKDSCTYINVDLQTAISFLKRETINLNDKPKGYLLICFQNLALGWVKNIGKRCNNLYPQHWRIRMNIQV